MKTFPALVTALLRGHAVGTDCTCWDRVRCIRADPILVPLLNRTNSSRFRAYRRSLALASEVRQLGSKKTSV